MRFLLWKCCSFSVLESRCGAEKTVHGHPKQPKPFALRRFSGFVMTKRAAERERRADFSAIVRAFNIVYNLQK